VHAQNLVVDQGGNGKAVKNILEFFPNSNGVSTLALIVESVNSVNLGAFVVTSQEEEVLLVFNLVGKEKDNNFETSFSAVNVVSQKEVVSFGWESSIFKKTEKIGELSVDISANLNWGLEFKENRLFHEDLASNFANLRNIFLFDLFLCVTR
jgi:hypothetical protein